MKISFKKTASALVLGALIAGPAAALDYEVWVSDQTNSAGIAMAADTGTHGGFIRIYDSADLLQTPPVDNSTVIDVATWANGTGANLTRLHGVLPSPNHNYMNVNLVASGHLAIVDARTKTPVALFRSTGTTTGRQNHMSFWSPDGRYLLVANQNGKLLERVKISYDPEGENITAAVWEAAATLDLVGGAGRITAQPVADTANYPLASVSGAVADGQPTTTPIGNPKEAAGVRPNNTNICPIVGSNGLVFVTLGGGGMFVVDYTTTPMTIVGEYDTSVFPAAGCGGAETGGHVYMNQGTPGPDISMFSVVKLPLAGYSASYTTANTPAPVARFDDPDNGLLIHDDNRDAHGMGLSNLDKYLHQYDRVRNNVEVFDVANFPAVVNTYDLTTSNGKVDGPAGTVCGTTLGAPDSNDPTPDLYGFSPQSHYIYVALRGPFPLSVSHAAQGSCPGLGIVKISEGGKHGRLVAVLPTSQSNYAGTKNISDPHGSAVRIK
jgi:hypothetical protein